MEENLVLRLTRLVLMYASFTLAVETCKRPIRKLVDNSSIDPIGNFLILVSSLWNDVSVASSSARRKSPAPSTTTQVMRAEGDGQAKPTEDRVKRDLSLTKVAVDDLCQSCREGWNIAEEVKTSFRSFNGLNCAYELFEPCKLCRERVQGLSRLERTFLEHDSPP